MKPTRLFPTENLVLTQKRREREKKRVSETPFVKKTKWPLQFNLDILLVFFFYPTSKGGLQDGGSVGIRTCCTHVFARLIPVCMLSRCLATKFLPRSSGGSLLRVHCWLGTKKNVLEEFKPFFSFSI